MIGRGKKAQWSAAPGFVPYAESRLEGCHGVLYAGLFLASVLLLTALDSPLGALGALLATLGVGTRLFVIMRRRQPALEPSVRLLLVWLGAPAIWAAIRALRNGSQDLT